MITNNGHLVRWLQTKKYTDISIDRIRGSELENILYVDFFLNLRLLCGVEGSSLGNNFLSLYPFPLSGWHGHPMKIILFVRLFLFFSISFDGVAC